MEKSHRPKSRFLLDGTPVMAVQANGAGISILGQDAKFSKFVQYEKSYQARIEEQNTRRTPGRPSFAGEDAPLQLNVIQRSMYRRLMYGLKEYSPEQLAGMDRVQIARVQADHERCNRALHRLKCDVHLGPYNKLINALFQHVPKLGTKASDYEIRLPERLTLNKLKIGTRQVVDCLMAARLLPADFLATSVDTLDLR